MRDSFPPSSYRRPDASGRPSPSYCPRNRYHHHQPHRPVLPNPSNDHQNQSKYQHRSHFNPNLPPGCPRGRPPGIRSGPPGLDLRPNFAVHLLHPTGAKPRVAVTQDEIENLLSLCDVCPETPPVRRTGAVCATIAFREWVHALAALLALWSSRLQGNHDYIPKLIPYVVVRSDSVELDEKMRSLFREHLLSLIDGGEIVSRWEGIIAQKTVEIDGVTISMQKRLSLGAFCELKDKKKGLEAERDLIKKRVTEFKTGLSCVLRYLERKGKTGGEEEVVEESDEVVEAFSFDSTHDWVRIHQLVRRECRRLDDGLPIYGYRLDILRRIHGEQVLVLIGETGSGKSTQLVQFLADSGVAANGSIVCTQPRKIAAISLAHRVRDEADGCYADTSVCCFRSSGQQINSKLIYTTDNSLLQLCMKDRNLSGISCIIVDEAHERSLNTDLLLALLKDLLCRRVDLRLVIMSATANANQLADYFFGCAIYHVTGRTFPVEITYTPYASEWTYYNGSFHGYVQDVVKMALEVHKTQKDGTILAFLTSQADVEWACEKFDSPSAIALPLHGKLSFEEQFRVFQSYHGKRKVIFSTNIAETSLTIPGVRYVIDSGMVKESKYEASTGMNVLRVGWVSQSSANQRAGRAGRTGPGRCYRLYRESDFESMPLNQEPEIRRVHLGVAVLRILSLGVESIQAFDFVDSPSPEAVLMASRNLIQLGAITEKNGVLELTQEGQYLVKLGVEPRLGKLILSCFGHHMGKEGLVLAAVMANASSIFCRVGSYDDKQKADCLKVQFCNQNGDLFTLLSVYREWESLPQQRRKSWCWENSINAKSLQRCEDTIKELEACLEKELAIIIPRYWVWNPDLSSRHDKLLKRVILLSLAENVAMYTGSDQLGYQVAMTGQNVQLHPSCSLLVFGQKPGWVVFSELLSITNQYLVCVTAFDVEELSTLDPPPLFDFSKMESQRLLVKVIGSFGRILLKRFCGKSNKNLNSLVARARSICMDARIQIEVNINQNEILLFAPSECMENVSGLVTRALESEKKWVGNECLEKCLYQGPGITPVALFGAGAQIRHLELDKRFLTLEVHISNGKVIDDKELILLLEEKVGGTVCSIHKPIVKEEDRNNGMWGRVTFLTPDSASRAAELHTLEFNGTVFKLIPSRTTGGDHKAAAVKAKIFWPRRRIKGTAFLRCKPSDAIAVAFEICNLPLRCELSKTRADTVVIYGLDRELTEKELLNSLRTVTSREILDVFLPRDAAVDPSGSCEGALFKEISQVISKKSSDTSCYSVQVLPPEPKDYFVKALITFDGSLHLEAAKALQELEGKVLPGCLPWQKIKCQRLFSSSLSCSPSVYNVIKRQLDCLLGKLNDRKDVECVLEQMYNGCYRVKISATATKTIADVRGSLEELMRGRTVKDSRLTPSVLQNLFSREGSDLIRIIQKKSETYILFDRHNHNVRVFGSPEKVYMAEQELIKSLLMYHENKQLEIHLRGSGLPMDLMKEVVKRYGPDLHGLEEKVPGVELTLNARHQIIFVHGDRDMKQRVERVIYELRNENNTPAEKLDGDVLCPICLCEIDDPYPLEGCSHSFCRSCLVEQFDSAIKNLDAFPILCAHEGCEVPIFITDLKTLLPSKKLDELFRASLAHFVASSCGAYRFCPSPDCPSVYRVADPGSPSEPFCCGACFAETCTRCHLEYHPYISCEMYREFKDDPDLSLKAWSDGKEDVKKCPVCGYTIEKVEGCNHLECKCGRHICWACLEDFSNSNDCYDHLRKMHNGIL